MTFSNGSRSNLQKGYSLIEIMIVIMIIGVLAAGVIGGFRYLQRAKIATTNSKLAALDTLLESYNTQLGEYPDSLEEVVSGPTKPNLQKRWGAGVGAEASDLQDSWKQTFVYQLNPPGSRPPYVLYSMGPKGDAQIHSPRSQA